MKKLLQEVEDQKALISKDEELFQEAAKLEAEAAEKHTKMLQDEQSGLKEDKKKSRRQRDHQREVFARQICQQKSMRRMRPTRTKEKHSCTRSSRQLRSAKQRRKEQQDLQVSSAAGSQAAKGAATRTRSPEAAPDQDNDKRRKLMEMRSTKHQAWKIRSPIKVIFSVFSFFSLHRRATQVRAQRAAARAAAHLQLQQEQPEEAANEAAQTDHQESRELPQGSRKKASHRLRRQLDYHET